MHLTVAVTSECFTCAPPGHVKWWQSNYSYSRVCTSTPGRQEAIEVDRRTPLQRRVALGGLRLPDESVGVLPTSKEWAAIPGSTTPFVGAGST
jgi:hypothetical protein